MRRWVNVRVANTIAVIEDWDAEPERVEVTLPEGRRLPPGVELVRSGEMSDRWCTTALPNASWRRTPQEAIGQFLACDPGADKVWVLTDGKLLKLPDPDESVGVMVSWAGKGKLGHDGEVFSIEVLGTTYSASTLTELAHTVLPDVVASANGLEWKPEGKETEEVSAFFVSYGVIDDVLALWVQGSAQVPDGGKLVTRGRELLRMNAEAMAQRYPRVRWGDEHKGYLVKAAYYEPRPSGMSSAQLVKSANCLLYQCGEGDVPETWPAYRWVQALVDAQPRSLTRNLYDNPEYAKARWDRPREGWGEEDEL